MTEQEVNQEEWSKMQELMPSRSDIALEEVDDDEGDHRSLSQRMADSPKLSDMQTFDRRLFPDLGYTHLNNLQLARIFPDSFNPLQNILIKDLLQRDDGLTVGECIATVHTSATIAIDGEGRLDELGLAGVSHEETMVKEQNKMIG